MRYRRLGNTDISVSILGLGCWSFGGGPYWGERDEAESIETIRAALDDGINFFDTAEAYGDGYSELVLGKALGGRRREAVIATKINGGHLAHDDVQKACEDSLHRLGTDYIDLYQIHWPSRTVPLAETMASLESLRRQGKIRAIGVSNFGVGDLADALAIGRAENRSVDFPRLEANQLPYSLLWRAIEYEIVEKCIASNVGILCYSPLAQGLLSGNYTCADDVPEGRACTRWFSDVRPGTRHGGPGCEEEIFAAVADIRKIADRLAEPVTNVALAWLLQRRGVTSVLAGARSPVQLRLNAQAVELDLSPETFHQLTQATEALKEKLGPNPDMWQAQSRYR